MSILYGWELGSFFGHVGPFLPLARALRAAGHSVRLAVASTSSAAQLLDHEEFAWLQAPRCPERIRPEPPLTYADILRRWGYADAGTLLGLTVAWRELMRLAGAQLVLADHAPTALLAARTLGLKAMHFSTTFAVPPRRAPTPAMRPWMPLPDEQAAGIERPVLDSVNRVLQRFGRPPLAALWQLFDVDETALLGFEELDHYPERGPARYWGCLDLGDGTPVRWPEVPGRRVFAYLRTASPHHEAALTALAAREQPTVVFFPDAPRGLAERHARPHLSFAHARPDLGAVVQKADAAVSYGSFTTTIRFLLAGKPLLLLPGNLEQYLLAKRVEQLGAGYAVHPEHPPGDLGGRLHRLLEDPLPAERAREFARRHAGRSQEAVLRDLLRRIGELLAAAP